MDRKFDHAQQKALIVLHKCFGDRLPFYGNSEAELGCFREKFRITLRDRLVFFGILSTSMGAPNITLSTPTA